MGEFRPAALLSVRSTTLKFWGVKRKKYTDTNPVLLPDLYLIYGGSGRHIGKG